MRRIVFAKTHKCASSSLQNLFLRHADEHNLTIAFPNRKLINYYSHYPSKLSADKIVPAAKPYDLMCFHARFRIAEAERAMRQHESTTTALPEPLYVTILRDPVTHFESIYHYYKLGKETSLNASLEEFLREPRLFLRWRRARGKAPIPRMRNPMLYDFAVDIDMMDNGAAINRTIAELEARFDLVMIAERMDESLALLRRLLCWPSTVCYVSL